jgi:hypothetical protein
VTAVEEPALYVRDGSRFVLYDAGRQHTPPIPVPVPTEVEQPVQDPANPYRTILPDPGRCPHGSFPRYAAANCCAPGAGRRRGR